MMYELIPDELKKLPRWVCWRGTWKTRADGTPHLSKEPINPNTGGNAQSSNPETWADFDTAVRVSADFAGIGFMFSGSGYIGIDIDDRPDELRAFKNGEVTNTFGDFVETLQTYCEISQSGNGVHLIGKGALPGKDFKNSAEGIEMYAGNRFFVMTGATCTQYHDVKDITETVKPLYKRFCTKHTAEEKPAANRIVEHSGLSFRDILEKAMLSKNGDAFSRLYHGDFSGYPSQSEADIAFCNMLAFWTGRDPDLMDAIFRESGLMRDKWDRKQSGSTYGAITISRAIDDCGDTYKQNAVDDDFHITIKSKPKATAQARTHSFDDQGNAERFGELYGDIVKYSYIDKRWLFYSGGRWQYDNIGYLYTLADDVTERTAKTEAKFYEDEKIAGAFKKHIHRMRSMAGRENMIAMYRNSAPITPNQLDQRKNFFAVKNGVIDLKTGELLPHDKEWLITKQSPIEYDPQAGYPVLWARFLNDIFDGDSELVDYIQKCAGYSLTGSTKEQCAFFLYGNGRNGKSTFLDVLRYIFGDYAANIQAETIMAKPRTGSAPSSDIARLKGARFVTSSEPDDGMRLAEGLLKQLTGEEPVTARRMYGEEFEFKPEFKLWMATNHKPLVRGTDEGIWRRICLIPFEVQIPVGKVDKDLKYKLVGEAQGILRWMIEGCLKWQKEGLEQPRAVRVGTQEYRNEMDVIHHFIDDCCEMSGQCQAQNLYSAYKKWAEENGEFCMSNNKFGREIAKLPGMQSTKIHGCKFYQGIRLTGNYQFVNKL